MDLEIWKDIPGFEGKYQASDLGRIRSLIRKNILVLRPATDKHGYFYVSFRKEGIQKSIKVHRLVCFTFLGESWFEGAIVNHKDYDRKNNRVVNLEWCDYSHNTKHAFLNDRFDRKGEKNSFSRFTDEDIRKYEN